ncbi:MAG TPA: hypothetical protein VGE21_02520 [Flavobacteriales bacterium]
MNSKKIIGFLCWALSLIPFQYALLNTDTVVHADGSADNVKGLISFVAFLLLIFMGYLFVDSASSKAPAAEHGH